MQATTTLPKISIVMPVLNREDTIEKALRSLLDQHYKNLELIIIDGGSKDKTVDIIKQYEKHISYWHSKPDGSSSVAANLGIEKATGDLVALFMADDWYEAHTLHKIAQAFLAYPEADVFTCGGRIVYWDKKTAQLQTRFTYTDQKRMDLTLQNICFDITSAICCRFLRKTLLDRIGLFTPFDAKGKHMFSNDKELLMRAVFANAKNVFVDYLGHTYFAHSESATFGNHHGNIIRLCEEHREIATVFLQQPTLSKQEQFLLTYWYNDQSTRLLLFKLLDLDFRTSWQVAKDGFKKYPLFWPLAFIYTTGKIITKCTLRRLRKALS